MVEEEGDVAGQHGRDSRMVVAGCPARTVHSRRGPGVSGRTFRLLDLARPSGGGARPGHWAIGIPEHRSLSIAAWIDRTRLPGSPGGAILICRPGLFPGWIAGNGAAIAGDAVIALPYLKLFGASDAPGSEPEAVRRC